MFAGGLCCWRLQLNLSDDFSKTVQRAHLKKPTQINSTEKLLLLQPAPPTSCNNQILQNSPKTKKHPNPKHRIIDVNRTTLFIYY